MCGLEHYDIVVSIIIGILIFFEILSVSVNVSNVLMTNSWRKIHRAIA